MSVFLFYFGWPDGAVWSNLLASVICAAAVWWRLRARMIAHHAEQLAQAARHHTEHMAAVQHEDLKNHVAALLNAHCADLKEHVEATAHMTAAVAVPQQLLDDIKKRAPKRGGDPA